MKVSLLGVRALIQLLLEHVELNNLEEEAVRKEGRNKEMLSCGTTDAGGIVKHNIL
jgi:hypothetical protein